MIPVVAVVALLVSATCPQPVDRPDCVSVPLAEAATALKCVGADLPQCQQDREYDYQRAEAEKIELAETVATERRRADALDVLLAECARLDPPTAPWYERPWVVATVSVAVTVGIVAAVQR